MGNSLYPSLRDQIELVEMTIKLVTAFLANEFDSGCPNSTRIRA